VLAGSAPALAEPVATVKFNVQPAAWQFKENAAPNGEPNYLTSVKREESTEDGLPAFGSSVFVSIVPGDPYKDLEVFLDGFDWERIANTPIQDPLGGGEATSVPFTTYSDRPVANRNGTIELFGKPAYFTEGTVETTGESFTGVLEMSRSITYYIPLGDVGVLVGRGVMVRPAYFDQLDALWAENQTVFEGLDIEWTDGGSTQVGGGSQSAEGGLPWETAGAAAGAVAAAAAAVAGAAASGRGKKKKLDPKEHVGYVLELSTEHLDLSSAYSAGFSARVWKVLASGAVEPADDATVTLRPPPGVGVAPTSGPSPLEAAVWQTGDVAPGAALGVAARASKGATSAQVSLTGEQESTLEVTLEPPGKSLKPNGRDVARVVAVLKPSPAAQANPAFDLETARRSIRFGRPSAADWLDVGEEVDVPDGKAIPIAASPPDPDHPVTPPESVRVAATAQLGVQILEGSVTVALERPPVLDCRPDSVEFSVGTREIAESVLWVENPGGLEWAFTSKWREGDRPVARVEIKRETASTAVVTLTEDAVALPDIGRPEEVSTLVLAADGEGWDRLERYLKVSVTREGLFVDPVGRHPDGTFHLEARGEGEPTEIDVRVYARDESGTIRLEPELSDAVEWRPGGPEKTPGHTALGFREFTIEHTGRRGVENPSATFRAVLARKLPTSGEPVPAILRASVPGFDKPEFSADVALKLLGVDTSPFSPEWKLERERCLKIIEDFAPREHQQKFRDLVVERGPLMGAEGLYEMRKRVWDISENAFSQEAADWEEIAWYIEQVEGVLDWISYCGDIALGVASGSILGSLGAIGLGMAKPVLVSAMEAYVDGRDLTWWAKQQIVLGLNVVEGQWTDPDFIAHLTGRNKAVVWLAFIGYTFAKEWALDPEHSITGAMERTLKMLRDQAIISFLRMVTGATPGATPGAKKGTPEVEAPKRPTAPKPGRKPPAPGSVVRPGQKPPRPPPAPGSVVHPGPGAKKQTVRHKPAAHAPEFDAPDPGTRAQKMAKGVKDKVTKGADGKPTVDHSTMEKIMRDPDGARELRKNDPKAWEAYDNARQEVYGKHDAQLAKWVEQNVPEAKGQKVKVEPFGDAHGTDRDYRAGIVKKDPVTGKDIFIEIPKEKWAGKSQEIFSEVTGGPKDPAKAAEWSRQRQQLPTDGYHAEASVDMSDQAWVKNPATGKLERTQTTSNLSLTKQGKSTLRDPDGLGKTYETKVAESYHDGNTLDAYKQAEKATHSFVETKTGYMAQDYKMKPTPPEMLKGMHIVEKVASGAWKPEAGDAALKAAGLGDNLPEFMNKLSGQFAGFKFAKK